MTYGYARVSSKDQNLDRQINALIAAGVAKENIFSDKKSGKDFDRPAYKQLINTLKKDDLLIILSIDRLGRNYEEIIEQWRTITKVIQADIRVIDMPLLDTTYCKNIMGTFISDLVLQILSFQAEQERTYIKKRQAEGIQAAKARGQTLGRPRKPLPENFDELYERFKNNNEPIRKLARECNISESTLRLRLNERLAKDNGK